MTPSNKLQVQYLLTRYIDGKTSASEETQLFDLLENEKDSSEWETILEELMAAEPDQAGYNKEEWQTVIHSILSHKTATPVRSISRWKRIAIAASVLLAIATITFFLLPAKKENPIVINQPPDFPAPSASRAMITLADGSKVYLDNAANGSLAKQGNMLVTKSEDGKIIYSEVGTGSATAVTYNTLTNPRGSKIVDITLADGSRVWLNAGSSITYPVAFVGNERNVKMTGEAYFEISHNRDMPFKVTKDAMQVTVLGTHFNVNAYDDEKELKVTLVEGSVKVESGNAAELMKPGQQAAITSSGLTINNTPDLDEVLAWKNGYFHFNRLTLPDVMRQVSRWYDVDVRYEGAVTKETFSGIVSRKSNVSQVLRMMEQGGVKFKGEGKSVVVLGTE